MKIAIQNFTLTLLLLLAIVSMGSWSFSQYQQFQQQNLHSFMLQQQSWQQQIKSSQSDQLLWLQSRFYDMRAGLQQRPDATQRKSYINQYLSNVSELENVYLYSSDRLKNAQNESDCMHLAKSLSSDIDKGAPPLFFSCLHDEQQAMMGVKGDFRIYGQAVSLIILIDYFSFISEFERLSGIQLTAKLSALTKLVEYSETAASDQDLIHEIIFSREYMKLGNIRLYYPQGEFIYYWLEDAKWMIPLQLLLFLIVYRVLDGVMMSPLIRLSKRMHSVITALRPGNGHADNRLLPGMQLLQRNFMYLAHMARNDPLTGLHNRVIFEARVLQTLQEGKRSAHKYALVFIDIDGFNKINKKYGNYLGDGLLRMLAKRLTDNLRESDSLGRFEGDNFALLLGYVEDDQLNSFLDKIHQSLIQPYLVYGRHIEVSISIGVALYPQHAQALEKLALIADKALLEAQQGNGGVVIVEPSSSDQNYSGLSRMQSFRQALDNDEFKLVYQPVMDLKSHSTSYFEALLRWKLPGSDQLTIPQIIELAENNQAIRPLTRWIINTACQQLKQLDSAEIKVAINLSMIDLHDDELPQQITDALKKFDISAQQLMIEITEGQIMQDQEQVIRILNQLSGMGISLSIDDFGTGQASLTYLKKLPVQKLKIDLSFVKDMMRNNDDRTIVEATINLAHTLGIEVVAEGVESIEVHELLQQMGCDYVQGYYISKPMEAEHILKWCETGARAC
jgi:diguanylate cyclase (GGDEF)-like protein